MAEQSIAAIDLSATAKERVPIGTLPTAGEYAAAYVFFAAREDNVPATGSILNYDGGFGIRGLRQTVAGRDLPERISALKKDTQ
jgi:cis-2,3-dihydrobiphenyl-2,3-diol dehydrogenase